MIKILRQGDKLIGVYEKHTPFAELKEIHHLDMRLYLLNSLIKELEENDKSELFSYNIIEVKESLSPDLYGSNSEIIFEFIPNKELVEELKVVSERLQIGL
jgi:hypothetical protein